MMDAPQQQVPSSVLAEAAVDDAIASCDGDSRATVRALLIALGAYEAELASLKDEVARISAAVSPGFIRERLVERKRRI